MEKEVRGRSWAAEFWHHLVIYMTHIIRVGQNRIYTPYLTVYLVNCLPKIPYTHRIYTVLANHTYHEYADQDEQTLLN